MVRQRWDTVGGLSIHSRHAGTSGPDVVCVHGLGVSSAHMAPMLRVLSPAFRAHALDLPGFGWSDDPATLPDVDELAEFLEVFIEETVEGPSAILANSLGCQVAIACAQRRPDLVAGMVLVGPTVDPAGRSAAGQIGRYLLTLPGERLSQAPLVVRDYCRAGPRRIAGTFRYGLADVVKDRLPGVGAPTLVVRGSRDRIAPQAWVEEMARLLPHGRTAVIPGAAHTPHFTAPDTLGRIARPFLEGDLEEATRSGRP